MDPHADQPIVAAGTPLGEGAGVVILLHGRNAAPGNILTLAPRLARPAFSYLAPAAANRSWYPLSFMADQPANEPYLSSAIARIGRMLADLSARGIPSERTVLMGFSQGACLASEVAARHAQRFGGIIIFTGGLIGPPGTPRDYAGSFEGTPVFLGCSDADAHVPQARVDESAAVFTRMGAAVTERIYPGMGHLVNDDEIAFAQSVLDATASGSR